MPKTHSEVTIALDEMAQVIKQNREKLGTGPAIIDGVVTTLGGMPAKYAPYLTAINDALVAAPGDEALIAMKKHFQALHSEFTALQVTAEAYKAALDAIS